MLDYVAGVRQHALGFRTESLNCVEVVLDFSSNAFRVIVGFNKFLIAVSFGLARRVQRA